MPIDTKVQHRMEQLLAVSEDSGVRSSRLVYDAKRLWQRVQRLIELNLTPPELNRAAMELACYALQLPLRQGKGLSVGRLGQVSLRERAEQSAELIIGVLADCAAEELLDHTTDVLRELPARAPKRNESKLLADAVNLDDFGITGLILQAMQLARQQVCLVEVAQGFEKRQLYGYWEARLKDGFHFEPVRQMARKRLEGAQQMAGLLLAELREDSAL
ncbi:MAG: hypothetical protein ACM359_03445 [Bacillota bacterium]